MPGVVCLLATLCKNNYWTDLHGNFTTNVQEDKEELIKSCGTNPLPHLDLGIFKMILQHCEIGHISTIWPISLLKLIRSLWEFYHERNFEQGGPIKFWKSSGSVYPDCGYGLQIRTRFALVEVCALRVLCSSAGNTPTFWWKWLSNDVRRWRGNTRHSDAQKRCWHWWIDNTWELTQQKLGNDCVCFT